MLGKDLGLALHELGGMHFKRFGNVRVQLLPGAAQEALRRRLSCTASRTSACLKL
jgi:hypothetical protein